MSLSKVLDTARGEIGQKENPPGSNKVKYWEVMPSWNGQPWCVVFLLWCFRKAGEALAFFGGAFTASCSTLLAWYKSQGQTVPVSDVRPGDIVFLSFHGGKDPEHCGLVQDAGPILSGPYMPTRITTIEGNTSEAGSQSDGGAVCSKTRYPSQIVAVARPQYKPVEPAPVDDITGHWAENAIRKAIHKGILKGYDDGKIRPDQPITRAELVTILERLGLLE